MPLPPKNFHVADSDFPCYGCQERNVGCHSKCDKYNQAKEELAETTINIKNQYMREKKIDSYKLDSRRQAIKNKRR